MTNDIYLNGYNVYQGTTLGGPYPTQANSSIISTGSNSFTITGLTNGTPYYFVVTSLDTPDLESADSIEVTATPAEPPPAPPGGGGCGMIDLGKGGPSDPLNAIAYLLTLFLPLILMRMFRRRRAWRGIKPISPAEGFLPLSRS